MMKILAILFLLSPSFGMTASLPTLSESEAAHFQMLVEGNNRFAFDLYHQVKSQPGNIYFSPYSIVTGLGMLAIGAKGETALQFQHVFHYTPALLLFIGDLDESLKKSSGSKNITQVSLANALWLDKTVSILPSFKLTLMRNFRFTLQPVDFADDLTRSIQKINQWVLQQSKGLIRNVISSQEITANMRMVLTTAADLKGFWADPFDRNLTKRSPFQITAQRTLITNMMQKTSYYLLRKGERWDLLVIPYAKGEEGAQLAMGILLPKKGVPLAELERDLNWKNWEKWKKEIKNQLVALTFPSFRIDKRLNLKLALRALGLDSIFGPEANFSDITNQKEIYLNQILHKTSISIDEKGADMRDIVGVKSAASLIEQEVPYEFLADRPFIFLIWDQKTNSILFIGRLVLP